MSETEKAATPMCDDCKKLVGEHRHTPAHANLTKTDFKEFPSMFGNVDEHYYRCSKCGKDWMKETGSYGQGWVE